MAAFINGFNLFLFLVFSLCYVYQIVYVAIVLVKDHRSTSRVPEAKKLHRYAVLIAGRNEEAVVGELVKSIKEQDYPSELVDIYVIADNCTDNTAQVAAEAGAEVLVRNDQLVVGKSHALDFALNRIRVLHGDENGRTNYDGYFVFDADNVLDPGFITAMNRGFDAGSQVLTCYRNSKNYDSNWVSAGSGLWFLREARFLSNARDLIGSSCAISGTGFLISADILEGNGGWIHHLLTEDIEFSAYCISNGIRIGYCPDAIVYDEQPTTMRDSWRQRLRWAKGFYQVLVNYGHSLISGIIHNRDNNRFPCYDMLMTIAPAMLLTITGAFVNAAFMLIGIIEMAGVAGSVQDIAIGTSASLATADGGANWFTNVIGMLTGSMFQGDALNTFTTGDLNAMLSYSAARSTLITSFVSFMGCFVSFAGIMFLFSILTTISEWNQIHASTGKKIKYIFTFPVFMLTYVPIALIAMFKRVEWKPIRHTIVRSVSDITDQH
ncbi:MAG: glycosyltransferase family 2 protein [Coriobacteriaceae bacterium]|nr:glycosyltransferase family 2 protein [Coriobacteriaceae bacterium]